MRNRREDAGREIENGVARMPQVVFDVVAEDPEKQHVAEQVHQAAVHEHRNQQREIHRAGRLLQRNGGGLVADLDAHRPRDVLAGADLLRHGRERVGELLVRAHPLQEHEHQHIERNQQVGDVRRAQPSSVVVADRKDHFTPPSAGYLRRVKERRAYSNADRGSVRLRGRRGGEEHRRTRVAADSGVPGAHACALGCNGAPRRARSRDP